MVRVRTSRWGVLRRPGDLLPLCVRSKVTKTYKPTYLWTSILLGDFDDLDHMAGKVQACGNLLAENAGLGEVDGHVGQVLFRVEKSNYSFSRCLRISI